MEKLILRSILYGADKIPDSWFEKIPGGFYKAKKKAAQKEAQKEADARDDRRKSAEVARSRHHGRRYSASDSTRATPPDEEYDSGYRSEGHKKRHKDRDRNVRRSYDGIDDDDDDYYYSGDDRRRSRRHDDRHRSKSHRDSHDRQSRHSRYVGPDMGMPNYPPEPRRPYYDERAPAMAPVAAPPVQPAYPTQGGVASGYVPYSHIYGGPKPAPLANMVPSPPGFVSPLAPPAAHAVAPAPYQQNVDAQQAPTAAAAGAGAIYTGQPGFINTEHWEPRTQTRNYDRINGYDGDRRQSRRNRSPSVGSYDSRGGRQSRDDRRDADVRRTMSQGGKQAIGYVDPRMPLSAQMSKRSPSRYNDKRKSKTWQQDGAYDRPPRREDSKRDSHRDGYRSE